VTDVQPFRALRYDPKRVDLAKVLAPPYDVIPPDERARLWERDPHCAVRLELTREIDEESRTDYHEAAERLAGWRRSGILVRDARPAFYVLRQRFAAPDGSPVERVGWFAALRLEDYERRVVRPHERTLAAPKADRLKLLRATRANLSAVFFLYEDRELALAPLLAAALEAPDAEPIRDAEGVEHTLVRVEDPGPMAAMRRFLADRPSVIADGHHRYETALAYRDERLRAEPTAGGDAPFRSLLGYFANAYAPGTLLLPIHRVVRKGPAPTDAAWRDRLAGWEQRAAAVADAGEIPALLGRLLEREGAVDFPKSALAAARQVREGRGAVAIYLNPLEPADVFRVTAAGELLPQKSTYFHPKLPTGLLFRCLEPDA
jgi:uncharacterized protein (DUF1015 family)